MIRKVMMRFALAALIPSALTAEADLRLWYEQPAKAWDSEALPMGNGRLGAMAFGGVEEDRFLLNESTIWAGKKNPGRQGDLSQAISKARALLAQGKAFEAQELLQNDVMSSADPERYQPLGDLLLGFSAKGEVKDYTRSLDLNTGMHELRYTQDGVSYRRRSFVSAADQVMVVFIEADKPGKVSVELELKRLENAQQKAAGADSLIFSGQAGDQGRPSGTRFEARLLALPKGGKLSASDAGLKLKGADALLLLLDAATDYDLQQPQSPKPEGFASKLEGKLRALSSRGFGSLLAAHISAYKALFDRVQLNLGASPSMLPTDGRLEAYRRGAKDPGLEALYFQYGRYLLLSSSQGGPLPANLQGLWNEHLSPPWSADFHVNINLQMNYWPAEPGALGECQLPLFGYLEAMRPAARLNAAQFGLKGLVTGHTMDAWGTSALQGRTVWGLWVMGMAWCSQHYMEHYRYSGDEVFLRERAWPFLKESAEFLLGWLQKDPKTGKLVSGPVTSPENQYLDAKGRRIDVSMGPAMDQEIAWETFNNILEAAKVLGIDDAFVQSVAQAQKGLALPGIGSDGRLLEWAGPWAETEPGHRHISHLFAVYPGSQFSAEKTPQLMKAAERSLEARLKNGGGHTGWSRAWIINFWARFRQGEKAYENLRLLLSKSTVDNLFDTHPPFQIDGNFGGAAGMMEMLLQSQSGELQLLPALPSSWEKGDVRGLRARGGYSVDMAWEASSLKEALITASRDGSVTLRYAGRVFKQDLKAGGSFKFIPPPGLGPVAKALPEAMKEEEPTLLPSGGPSPLDLRKLAKDKVISINFVGGSPDNGDPKPMGPGERAGAVKIGHWNNALASSGDLKSLKDGNGGSSKASLFWESSNTWSTPLKDEAGDARMMKGYLDTSEGAAIVVKVEGLPAAFLAKGYRVYAYFDGDEPAAERSALYSVSGWGRLGVDLKGSLFSGAYGQENFVAFEGLKSKSFTLKARPKSSTGKNLRAPLNGIQIIAEP